MAVRGNLSTFADAADWWEVCTTSKTLVASGTADEDRTFLKAAAGCLPEEPWDVATYGVWISQVKAETGRSGKGLFKPLRLALTGRETGPELAALLPLMGRGRAVARLSGTAG